MGAIAKKGDARATLQLVAEMKAQGLPITSLGYNHALNACAKAPLRRAAPTDDGGNGGGGNGGDGDGYLSEARVLFEELRTTEHGPDVVNYNTYLQVLAQHGQVEEARRVLAEMEKRGVQPDVITYNTYLQVLARHGQVEEARGVLGEMEKRGVRPDVVTYNTYLQVLARHGEVEEALHVLREMEKRGVRPDVVSYTTVLAACVPKGQWPVALYLHGEADLLLGAAHEGAPCDTSMQRRVPSRVEPTDRLQVLQTLLGVLEQLGVDGLFAAHVYEEAARRGGDRAPRWVRLMDGSGDGLDLQGFSRPTAKVALAHVLERDFVASADAGIIRPLAIIVGRGKLKEEVQRFLASLDPPLRAVTPPYNAGLLVVSWDQLRAYVMVERRRRRRQTTSGPALRVN